jgi:hypothetical protein
MRCNAPDAQATIEKWEAANAFIAGRIGLRGYRK